MLSGKCSVCKTLMLIGIFGAFNWGFIGILDLDLAAKVLGPMSVASRIVYTVIGLSGLAGAAGCFLKCPKCITRQTIIDITADKTEVL